MSRQFFYFFSAMKKFQFILWTWLHQRLLRQNYFYVHCYPKRSFFFQIVQKETSNKACNMKRKIGCGKKWDLVFIRKIRVDRYEIRKLETQLLWTKYVKNNLPQYKTVWKGKKGIFISLARFINHSFLWCKKLVH